MFPDARVTTVRIRPQRSDEGGDGARRRMAEVIDAVAEPIDAVVEVIDAVAEPIHGGARPADAAGVPDELEYATTLLELGALAAQQTPTAGAQALFERAIKIARERRSDASVQSLQDAISELQRSDGDRAAVLRCLRKANHLLRRLGMDPNDDVTSAERLTRMLQSLEQLHAASTPPPDPADAQRANARLDAHVVLVRGPVESAPPSPSRAAAAYERYKDPALETGEYEIGALRSQRVPKTRG